MTNAYEVAFKRAIKNPEEFWGEAAKNCHWYKKWDKVLDDSNRPFYRWFVGGELNSCYNALDCHIENGRGNQTALIYDSPVTNQIKKFTYTQLRDEVATFAGALADIGVKKGDCVIIYMPMIPEAAIAMLGCARIGAVHSVVFGGFAANELATRINDAKPKVIVSASCGIEIRNILHYKPLLDDAIEMATSKPERCIIYQRPMVKASMIQGRDLDWNDVMSKAKPHDCVPVAATEQYPRGLGPTVAAIAEGLADIPSKTLFSCGECPGIFSRWRMEGRGRVLVTGIEAHVCVAQTVLDLLADDWLVYVAVDAISSRFPQDMETALRRLECEGAILTTVEAALFEWCEQAGTSEFKQISRLVREELPRGKPVENSGPASSFT